MYLFLSIRQLWRSIFNCFNFSAYIRFFVNILIDMYVNMSKELNFFSDVYRSVNYIGSLAKLT